MTISDLIKQFEEEFAKDVGVYDGYTTVMNVKDATDWLRIHFTEMIKSAVGEEVKLVFGAPEYIKFEASIRNQVRAETLQTLGIEK